MHPKHATYYSFLKLKNAYLNLIVVGFRGGLQKTFNTIVA